MNNEEITQKVKERLLGYDQLPVGAIHELVLPTSIQSLRDKAAIKAAIPESWVLCDGESVVCRSGATVSTPNLFDNRPNGYSVHIMKI